MRRNRLALFAGIALLASIILLGRVLSVLLVDYSWYASFDALNVWEEKVRSILFLKGGAWLFAGLFMFANLWAVRKTILSITIPVRVGDLEFAEEVEPRIFFYAVALLSFIAGALFSLPANDWTIAARVLGSQPFHEYESFLHKDLGFYVNWFPFESAFHSWLQFVVVSVTLFIMVQYVGTRDLRIVDRRIQASTHVRRHLTALVSILLLILAWGYRLDAFELLMWGSGNDGLFTRADHKTIIRLDLVLSFLTAAAALVVLRAGWMGQIRAALLAISLVLIGSLVVRPYLPEAIVSKASYDHSYDADYRTTRALFTRRAYAIDNIRTIEDSSISSSEYHDLLPSIKKVAWWDALQLHDIRQVSDQTFEPIGVPVWISGESAPQAIQIVRSNSDWSVRITEGSKITSNGEPVTSRVRLSSLDNTDDFIATPGSEGHRLVHLNTTSRSEENTWPSGEPVLASALTNRVIRLAHAWVATDASILSPRRDGSNSGVVMHRDIRARIDRLVPGLIQSESLVPIVAAGRLLWSLDLYSHSSTYPLSTRFHVLGDDRGYFRHAATALVDARTGSVRFIGVDKNDPIASFWLNKVSSLVVSISSISSEIAHQLPIPFESSYIQLRAFSRVGTRSTNHSVLHLPDSIRSLAPYPVFQTEGSISWSVPLIDDADQLLGLFNVSGGDLHGQAVWYPISSPLPRWTALRELIGVQADSIVASFTDSISGLVARKRPFKGNWRAIPIGGRPVLLKPVYLDNDGFDQLAAIAVVDGMGSGHAYTAQMLSDGGGEVLGGLDWVIKEGSEASLLYQEMRQALKEGNWHRFGVLFDSLGGVLQKSP